jgi:hypothetical protein
MDCLDCHNRPARSYGLPERAIDNALAGSQILAIRERNIFPDMKVTWGKYPLNIGHTDSPGCFRFHDDSHASPTGKKITRDCNACHNVPAVEEAAPKTLQDLGIN